LQFAIHKRPQTYFVPRNRARERERERGDYGRYLQAGARHGVSAHRADKALRRIFVIARVRDARPIQRPSHANAAISAGIVTGKSSSGQPDLAADNANSVRPNAKRNARVNPLSVDVCGK